MLRATIASIRAHKLRLVATSLAIVVGVAFVTGTLVISDTLTRTFDDLFSQTNDGIDVAVRGPEDSADGLSGLRDPLPTELLDQIAAVDGVAAVSPEVQGFVQLIGPDGEPIGGFGPPTIAFNAPTSEQLDSSELRSGAYPAGPDEIAIDAGTAEAEGIEIGDVVPVAISGPVQDYTVVGTIGFGDLDNLAGATLVIFALETAFELFGDGGYQTIYAAAEDGVSPDALRDDVAAAIGGDYEVQTGVDFTDSQTAEIGEGLSFLTTGLLAFAGVALFVGAFLIANTFSIIVAQRTRELALLRAIGASRRQVMLSVLGEALLTGLVGSAVGFGAGIALAGGLYAILNAFGVSLPEGDLVVSSGTLIIALVLGTVLTVVVALAPAARSTRVPPVAALQAVAAPPPPRYGRLRYVLGGLVFAGGIAGLAVALAGNGGLAAVGAAAAITLLGASFLAPLVTRPLLLLLGRPLSATRGMAGTLATENALRNPRRTAATASALMIGLALVSFAVIMASSFSASAERSIDQAFAGDFQIASTSFINTGGSPGAGFEEEIEAVDGVAAATTGWFASVGVFDGETFLTAMDAEAFSDVFTVTVTDGGDGGVLATGLAIATTVAEREGLAVGDPVELAFSSGTTTLPVGTIFESNPIAGEYIVSTQAVPGGEESLLYGNTAVLLEDDADVADARAGIESVLEAYPTLQVQDLTDIKAEISSVIDNILGLMTALLGLSVIVALFGIVNTLGLSVFERTRELGLLRAVGASRSQIRSMVRYESVLIALLGAVFGLLIGVLFAWMVIVALGDEAPLSLTIPIAPLVAGLIASALAGVGAAVLPSIRASRLDVLRALEAQ